MHIHAEGPAFFAWLPKMFGKRVVVTVHGIDWQREKWQSGLGSKFIHMLNNPNTHQNCEKCLGGHFVNCMKGKCIHGSTAKSAIGMMEAEFWKWKGTYKYIDTMICCSEFMKGKMDSNPLFATKTVAMHNFIDKVPYPLGRLRACGTALSSDSASRDPAKK